MRQCAFVVAAHARVRARASWGLTKMIAMFAHWPNRSAWQPKHKHRARCGAKTRAGGRCLVRTHQCRTSNHPSKASRGGLAVGVFPDHPHVGDDRLAVVIGNNDPLGNFPICA
jgi:hypothetical protein